MDNDTPEATPADIPWPRVGDALLQQGADAHDNARLDFGCNRWDIYATGYKTAADIVADRALGNRHEMDFLIYPIVFLYRHYLELRLKELIIVGHELLDRPLDLQIVHRLDSLWASCRRILTQVWPHQSTATLDAVQACIGQLSQVDPQSISFRYPTTRDGNPTLMGMSLVDLRNLRDVMDRTSSLLEGSSDAIADYLHEARALKTDLSG